MSSTCELKQGSRGTVNEATARTYAGRRKPALDKRKVHFTTDFSNSQYVKAKCGLIPRKGAKITKDWTQVTCLTCQKSRPLETKETNDNAGH